MPNAGPHLPLHICVHQREASRFRCSNWYCRPAEVLLQQEIKQGQGGAAARVSMPLRHFLIVSDDREDDFPAVLLHGDRWLQLSCR